MASRTPRRYRDTLMFVVAYGVIAAAVLFARPLPGSVPASPEPSQAVSSR
ncbi:hypothetical protein [Ancylobacter terrae]